MSAAERPGLLQGGCPPSATLWSKPRWVGTFLNELDIWGCTWPALDAWWPAVDEPPR